jgi:putative ABC transport system substrate-binding protein
MHRRSFLCTAAGGFFLAGAGPAAAGRGEPPAPCIGAPRIGVLGEVNPFAWEFGDADVELVCRWASAARRPLPDLAAELVAHDVDVIVAVGARAARAAGRLTGVIPVVFVIPGDPIEERLVPRLDRPGRNVTGLSLLSDAELAARRLALLREVAPGLARLGVLRNPDNALHEAAVAETLRVAERSGIGVCAVEARLAGRLDEAFAGMAARGVDAFVLLPDAMFSIHAEAVVAMAAAHRLPGVYPARSFAQAGGLLALHGDSAAAIGRLRALLAKILAGAPPAALPVERLDSLELTVNLGTVTALGLDLPRQLLARADALLRH